MTFEKVKRLDARSIRLLHLQPGTHEMILKINELVEKVNSLQDQIRTLRGDRKWEMELTDH